MALPLPRLPLQYVLFLLLASLLNSALAGCPAPPIVKIDAGILVGTTTKVAGATATVSKFLGVPFAASPIRFEPPSKPTPWPSPFRATAYGPACPQQFSYPDELRDAEMAWFNTPPPPAGESEDCLNLNVYVPGTPSSNKAVMAWIYVRSWLTIPSWRHHIDVACRVERWPMAQIPSNCTTGPTWQPTRM